jgi:hypothetical protein
MSVDKKEKRSELLKISSNRSKEIRKNSIPVA